MQQSTRKFQAIIGLGNPGKRYLETRHNAGFQVVDRLHQIYDGLTWKKNNTAWTSAVSLKGKFVRLLKPATFMNHSGLAVSQFVMKFLLDPTELIVIHDDLDIELERVKVKLGGGHAGHKGVKSIVEHLKTVDFARVRVGIGRPEKENAIDFVLSSPQNEEEAGYRKTIETAVAAVELIISENIQTAMGIFKRKYENQDDL